MPHSESKQPSTKLWQGYLYQRYSLWGSINNHTQHACYNLGLIWLLLLLLLRDCSLFPLLFCFETTFQSSNFMFSNWRNKIIKEQTISDSIAARAGWCFCQKYRARTPKGWDIWGLSDSKKNACLCLKHPVESPVSALIWAMYWPNRPFRRGGGKLASYSLLNWNQW